MIRPVHCPICQKLADNAVSPFCSKRCRKIDFFRWWDGRYAISEPLSGSPEELALMQEDAQLHEEWPEENEA